jgi:hypothetical protein
VSKNRPSLQLPKCLFYWVTDGGADDEHTCNGPEGHTGNHQCICGAEQPRSRSRVVLQQRDNSPPDRHEPSHEQGDGAQQE